MRITDHLIADHTRLSGLLARAIADPLHFDHAAFEEFRAGILRHIAIEERLLFPEARRRNGGEPIAVAHRMRIDHAAITSLMVPTPDPSLVIELRAILDPHDALEECPGGVYEQCELLLGDDSAALAERARTYPYLPLMPHFDGDAHRRVYRTAREALEVASHITPPRRLSA